MTGVSINTVTKLLIDAGKVCAVHHSRTVQNVTSKRVQCDEIWSFNHVLAGVGGAPFVPSVAAINPPGLGFV